MLNLLSGLSQINGDVDELATSTVNTQKVIIELNLRISHFFFEIWKCHELVSTKFGVKYRLN